MTSVEIYTTQYCPYCYWAKELLSRKGVSFREIDVTADRTMRQQMIERADGRTTVPQTLPDPFVNGQRIGLHEVIVASDA